MQGDSRRTRSTGENKIKKKDQITIGSQTRRYGERNLTP